MPLDWAKLAPSTNDTCCVCVCVCVCVPACKRVLAQRAFLSDELGFRIQVFGCRA